MQIGYALSYSAISLLLYPSRFVGVLLGLGVVGLCVVLFGFFFFVISKAFEL